MVNIKSIIIVIVIVTSIVIVVGHILTGPFYNFIRTNKRTKLIC